MTYEQLKEALEIFEIGERACLDQIKQRHRKLVKRYHPDQGKESGTKDIRRINAACEVLMAYCSGYRYCFSEEEFLEQAPQERLRRQFEGDPLWGGGKKEKPP
jgi:DnaJ-class molecular chaperone